MEETLTFVRGLVSKIAFPFYFFLRSLLDAGDDQIGPFFDRVCSAGTEKACKLYLPGLVPEVYFIMSASLLTGTGED